MKNTLDPGLSTISKTAIILISTALLIGVGAANSVSVDPSSSQNPDQINSALLPANHEFGNNEVTRSYDSATDKVFFDVDTKNADGYAVVYVDNDNDGTIDYQFEMNGYESSGVPSELSLWEHSSGSWNNVVEMQDSSDVDSFEQNYGFTVDYEDKRVGIPVSSDNGYDTGTSFKYSVDTESNSYASGEASYNKEDSSSFSTVYAGTFSEDFESPAQNLDLSIDRSYDAEIGEATFEVSNLGGDTGVLYFDTDNDGTGNVQIGLYQPDYKQDSFPRAQVWKRNGDGDWTKDTRYQDKESTGDTGTLEFDSTTTAISSQPQEHKDDFSGEIRDNSITVTVDRSVLGDSFGYGFKDNGGSNYNYDSGSGVDSQEVETDGSVEEVTVAEGNYAPFEVENSIDVKAESEATPSISVSSGQGIIVKAGNLEISGFKLIGPYTAANSGGSTTGIVVENGYDGVTISDNTIKSFNGGIQLKEDAVVENNQISDTYYGVGTGAAVPSDPKTEGLVVRENQIEADVQGVSGWTADDFTVENNQIVVDDSELDEDRSSFPQERGVDVSGNNVDIKGNEIVSTGTSVLVQSGAGEDVEVNNNEISGENYGIDASGYTYTLDARHNYWGQATGAQNIAGDVEWRPYFPTEQALQNSNAYVSHQDYEVDQNSEQWAEDTNSERSTSEIRSIAQSVASSVPTMNDAEVRSIVESEVDGFVTESELESELDSREETIEEQEQTIEAQEERIDELESEVESLNDQMNQTLEVLEESGQAEVSSGPTGSFTVTSPEEEGNKGGGIGGFFSGLFG